MAEQNPTRHDPRRSGSLRCEDWERLLVDAVDGALSSEEFAAFEIHRQECAACAATLEEARRGVAWLDYLRDDPQVPGDLLGRILARTSGTTASTTLAVAAQTPLPPPPLLKAPPLKAWYRTALPAAHRVIEPRMWMTAAMAFFSIALTLNLLGIRLSDIRLADLRPSTVFTTVSRQYYSTKEEGVKYYDNLRFVYEMEARVRELRRSPSQSPDSSTGPSAPAPQTIRRPQSPSSLNRFPGNRVPGPRPSKPQARTYSLAAIDEAHPSMEARVDRATGPRAERSRA